MTVVNSIEVVRSSDGEFFHLWQETCDSEIIRG